MLERRTDGTLVQRRGARGAAPLLREIDAVGGTSQLNHVTIFPNEVPGFAFMCRGCPWDYSSAETDYSKVKAIEVATGPGGLQNPAAGVPTPPGGLGPNPFTVTAIQFYEDALAAGHKIAAVGSSDNHKGGVKTDPVTTAPIGQATTVVRAHELSESAVTCAVEAGHTFVKVWGSDRPDLRLEGRIPGVDKTAIFGDTVVSPTVTFTARVLDAAPIDGQPFQLLILKNGVVSQIVPVDGSSKTVEFAATGPGRYGLRLMRGSSIEAVSTPIWVRAGEDARIVTDTCKDERARKKTRAFRRR